MKKPETQGQEYSVMERGHGCGIQVRWGVQSHISEGNPEENGGADVDLSKIGDSAHILLPTFILYSNHSIG
jgi:hypothetical protein